jgi:hypothetical protein
LSRWQIYCDHSVTSADVRLRVGPKQERSRIFWELWIVASRIPRSKPYRPLSTQRVATTALRASGHRTVTQAGHHVETIESLELTIQASPKIIQRFKTFNNSGGFYLIAIPNCDQKTN